MEKSRLPPRRVSPEGLARKAEDFLATHHPAGAIPVPIEEIAEFGLDLNIIPLPNLYKDFGIESWLSADEKSIYVDQFQLENLEPRYRFTLAHELSHLLLHQELYRGIQLGSFEDWLQFQESLDPGQRDDYEWQARNLAGRILVPDRSLMEITATCLARVPKDLRGKLGRRALFGSLSLSICREFKVSSSVVEIRSVGDGVGARVLEKEAGQGGS